MKNKILLELQQTKRYTEDCIKAMQNFINNFVDVVNKDNQYFVDKIEEFGKRIKVIEEKLGIKPADKPEEKNEDAEGANNE